MPRIVGLKRAAELMMLGNRIDAQTALAYGIVNRVVPLAEHEAAVAEIARTLANGPTVAIGRTKALLESSLNNTLETQLELEGISVAECTTTEDHYEGALAFIEKRKPVFKGR
jgi:2-(1,2-epoxy-1,2-dihydrophenyl)acetyl-CoA isomerase